MYRTSNNPAPIKSAECPTCKSTSMLYSKGKLTCRNCGEVIGKTFNKYGAKRSEYNGKIYDSKFEASVAGELDLRKRVGDIKDFDTQYRVEIPIHRSDGTYALTVKHKVDFRIHHNDGSYELYEAKGIETDDYKWRRKMLENVWLPLNKDHTYSVVKQRVAKRKR